jgi:hypothetical protein
VINPLQKNASKKVSQIIITWFYVYVDEAIEAGEMPGWACNCAGVSVKQRNTLWHMESFIKSLHKFSKTKQRVQIRHSSQTPISLVIPTNAKVVQLFRDSLICVSQI